MDNLPTLRDLIAKWRRMAWGYGHSSADELEQWLDQAGAPYARCPCSHCTEVCRILFGTKEETHGK